MNGPSGSIFDPAAPEARAIADLFITTLWICAVIFAAVAGLVGYSYARYGNRPGQIDPDQVAGNKRVEIVWTIIPFLIVLVLFALTMRAMRAADPPAPPPREADLVIIGHQWWWEVHHPRLGYVAANEIHIPVGQPISVRLETADVLHEFWVPQLTRKMTTVPGQANHVWMQAERPGIYQGVCSEFCGTQHAWMRFEVVAEPPEQFEAWLRQQQQPAGTTSGAAARGRELFRTMTCVNCHVVQGHGGTSNAGPDLTHLASRRYLGAGIVPNTPENLRRWLRDPQEVKPGALMPNFKLTEQEMDDLLAYLATLR